MKSEVIAGSAITTSATASVLQAERVTVVVSWPAAKGTEGVEGTEQLAVLIGRSERPANGEDVFPADNGEPNKTFT